MISKRGSHFAASDSAIMMLRRAGGIEGAPIDDGVRDRGHRHIMFSPEYHYAGAACGPHKTFGEMCVIEFAATPNGAPKAP